MAQIEKPLKSANMAEVVQPWDAEYSDVDQELLFELILVSVSWWLGLLCDACLGRLPTTSMSSRCWICVVPEWRP